MSPSVFGYGSLVSRASVEQTLGRSPGTLGRADLKGWKRRWSQARDNRRAEKTFALADGSLPPYILGLNLERGEDAAGPVNGAVFELETSDLYRLDLREMRYDRIDVTDQVVPVGGGAGSAGAPPVFTYVAKAENFAPEPPVGAVVLATYLQAVETAFSGLGAGELERYRETTGEVPVEAVRANLVKDRIPPGNPRTW